MIPLNATVEVIDEDAEGRVVTVMQYLAGYTMYAVRFKKQYKGNDESKTYMLEGHEPDFKVVSIEDAMDLPQPDPSLPLGQQVSILQSSITGTVTAYKFSSSGCVEYEVTYMMPGAGVKRQLLEAEVLTPTNKAPIATGSATGAIGRNIAER